MLALSLPKSAFIRKLFFKPRCFYRLPYTYVHKHPYLRYEDSRFSSGKNEQANLPKGDALDKLHYTDQKKTEIIERENIWTIPNILCCTRIACCPYLGILIYDGRFNLAFYLMIIGGLTDVLDGFIARNFTSQSSKIGTFLDPLADKVLITTACIALTSVNLIPLPLTALILSRDIGLIAAGFHIRYKSLPPPKTLVRYFDATHATAKLEPTKISKFNSFVQLVAIGVSLMSPVVGFTGHPLLQYLWYFTASTTVASGVSYFFEMEKYKFSYIQRLKK